MAEHRLTDRQANVLKLVVEEYIKQDRPISSLFLTEKFDLGCSSATVRSIFKCLDDLGYLFAQHRSSGRVPTERAYRYYVTNLNVAPGIQEDEQKVIQAEYLRHDFRMAEILETTGHLLSMLTDYAAIIQSPAPDSSVLKHIELIDMGEDEVLVIIVARSGTVYSRTMHLERRIPGDYLRRISRQLNEMFKGMDLAEMRHALEKEDHNDKESPNYYQMITHTIVENFDAVQGQGRVIVQGLDKLYAHFGDDSWAHNRIRGLSSLIQSNEFMGGVFQRARNLDNFEILIEGDRDERLRGLSIITASYKMGEKRIGSLGVIGPNRMNYMRVVSLVEYIRHIMSNMITRISN